MFGNREDDKKGKLYHIYQLQDRCGRGRFGEVYTAKDNLERIVAIKILYNAPVGNQKVAFLEEARKLSQLEHFHIIKLLDFNIDDTPPYLVMEYAPNNLRIAIPSQPGGSRLSSQTILAYIQQAASALQYAHDQHVVHCDIKPENLLLDKHNRLFVSDFGIAISMQNTPMGKKHQSIGTPGYRAPEQIRGRPQPASDQYALGVVAYQLFTGRRPRLGERWLFLLSQLFLWYTPRLPVELASVIFTALARNPKRRFATIQTFAEAFEQAYTLATLTEKAKYY